MRSIKYIFPALLLLLATQVSAQKRYTQDGASRILELECFLPAGNSNFGGGAKIDLISVPLAHDGLRLNFGTRLSLHTAKEVITNFGELLLADGSIGRNYRKENWVTPNINIYSRLWFRVLNPLNISVVAGVSGYSEQHAVTAYFVEHAYSNTAVSKKTELNAEEANIGVGFFYDVKAMLNFRKWGFGAGFTSYTFAKAYSLQPTVGFWIGTTTNKK